MKVGPLSILVKVIKVIFRPDDHTVVLFLLSAFQFAVKLLLRIIKISSKPPQFFLNPGQNLVTLGAIH